MTRLLPFAAIMLPLASLSTSSAFAQTDAARSLNPLASLDESTLKGFVEQPLFEPSRHPPVVVPPVAYVAPPPSAPMPEPPPSLRLLGVVEGTHSLVAVVRRNDTGKTQTLRPGDRIGTWIVGVTPAGLRVMSGERGFDYSLFGGGPQQSPMPVGPPPGFVAPVAVREPTTGGSR